MLVKGTTPTLVLDLLKRYPGEDTINERVFGLKNSETNRDAVKRIFSMESCAPLAYFDTVKALIHFEKLSKSDRKNLITITSAHIRSEADEHGTLVTYRLDVIALEKMMEKKWLKLNDTSYFEFSHLLGRSLKMLAEAREHSSEHPCEEKECTEDQAKTILLNHHEWQGNLQAAYIELNRWIDWVSTR